MKRSLVTLLALSFTLVFSFVYLKVFVDDAMVTSSNQAIVYYLQVGAFKSLDNVKNKVEQLKQNGVDAKYFLQDELYFVVTGFSLDVNALEIQKQELLDKGITSYNKQIVIQDADIIKDIQSASYDELIEVMSVSK